MSNVNYPQPPAHKTFPLANFVIDSNFDSGNCLNAEKVGPSNFHIWIGTDHQKNNYRTWFHFSISGASPGTMLTFTVKNMQNQSRLLNEGLVPVCRPESSSQWRRISEKVNTSAIEYNEGWIEWNFKHKVESEEKYYFAFFYPWSNEDNERFLNEVQIKAKKNPDIYFYRGSIIRSLEGRPVQFLVISSNKYRNPKEDKIEDNYLFKTSAKFPHSFGPEKQAIVLSARVHPGEVPGSHVMTGMIKTLTEPDGVGKLLRDEFVFYIFPILNPDGVGRGHYRVDTNGINLNRCYISPSPKQQPSIYAIRKIIMHLSEQSKFYAFLDLHAHAARRGTFIYGNYSTELIKQTKACLFPKLLSMNSKDFEYEGCNFTQGNMYCKDRGDHMSKQGSGRVAMFKATKNVNCWTLECNYNISKVINVLGKRKEPQIEEQKVSEDSLKSNLIVDYKPSTQSQPTSFFTMEVYQQLGAEICETFLDMIEKNPNSRINNPENYYKSVKYVKMNLALSLLRMAPNRFESNFKKVFYGITNSESEDIIKNSLKALYFLTIRDARIPSINQYIKSGNPELVVLPVEKKNGQKTGYRTRFQTKNTTKVVTAKMIKPEQKDEDNEKDILNFKRESQFLVEHQKPKSANQILILLQQQEAEDKKNEEENELAIETLSIEKKEKKRRAEESQKEQEQTVYSKKVSHYEKQSSLNKVCIRMEQFRMIGISSLRKSMGQHIKQKELMKQKGFIPNYSLNNKNSIVPPKYQTRMTKMRDANFTNSNTIRNHNEDVSREKYGKKGASVKQGVIFKLQ